MADHQPKDSNSHMTPKRKFIIPNHHGENLVGILHDIGSKELVIICHGIKSTKERIPMVSLATAIERIGISTFRFDFAGNGESEGSFLYGNYRREVEDLHAVIEHFRGLGLVISTIIGHSKGGNVVLLYAAKYHGVHRVVNISGRFDLKKGIKGRLGKNYLERIVNAGFIDVFSKTGKFQYRVTKESLMDRLSTDVRAACRLIPENCRSGLCQFDFVSNFRIKVAELLAFKQLIRLSPSILSISLINQRPILLLLCGFGSPFTATLPNP